MNMAMKHLLLAIACCLLVFGCGSRERVDVSGHLEKAKVLLNLNPETNEPLGYLQSLKGMPTYLETAADRLSRSYFNRREIPPQYQQAMTLLDEAVRLDPQSAAAFVLYGILYSYMTADLPGAEVYLRGDAEDVSSPQGKEYLARATEMFEKALAIDPRNKDALWGLVLRDSRPFTMNLTRPIPEIEQSIVVCRRLLEIDPDNIHTQANLGIFLLQVEGNGEAERVILDLVERHRAVIDHPKIVEAMYVLGKFYNSIGDRAAAERMLRQAVAAVSRHDQPIPKGDGQYYFGCPFQALGDLYRKTDRREEAMKYYLQAADLGFTQAIKELELATDAFDAMDFEAAAQHADRVFLLRTNKAAMRHTGNALLSRGYVLRGLLAAMAQQYAEAEKDFAAAAEKDPRNFGVSVGRGHLRIIDRDFAQADELFAAALAEVEPRLDGEPENFKYHWFVFKMAELGLAWTAANRGDHPRALAHFDRVLARSAGDSLALIGKANSLIALRRGPEAEALLKPVLARDPENKYALAAQGAVKMNRGDEQGAETEFQKAKAAGEGEFTCPFEGLGLMYLRQGKIAEAEAQFDQAIAINPNIEYRKFIGLAKIYIMEGRLDEAEKLLRQSLQNEPENEEAKVLLRRIGREP